MRVYELDDRLNEAWKLPGWLGGASKAEKGAEAGTDVARTADAGTDAERGAAHAGGDISTGDRWLNKLKKWFGKDDEPSLTDLINQRKAAGDPELHIPRAGEEVPGYPGHVYTGELDAAGRPKVRPKPSPETTSNATPKDKKIPVKDVSDAEVVSTTSKSEIKKQSAPKKKSEPKKQKDEKGDTGDKGNKGNKGEKKVDGEGETSTSSSTTNASSETPTTSTPASSEAPTATSTSSSVGTPMPPDKRFYQSEKSYQDAVDKWYTNLSAEEKLAHDQGMSALIKNRGQRQELDALKNPQAAPGRSGPPSPPNDPSSSLWPTRLKWGIGGAAGLYGAEHLGPKAVDLYNRAVPPDSTTTPPVNPGTTTPAGPASTTTPDSSQAPAAAQGDPGDELRDLLKKNESYSSVLGDILKLSGQRAITERDNTSGLTKPRKIEMLKESASLNVNADNGKELTDILGDIMRLAGMKEVSTDMFPKQEQLPMVKALNIMGNELPLDPDHPGSVEIHGSMDAEGAADLAKELASHEEELTGDSCPSCGQSECGCEDMEETYDNTPDVKVQKYDPNNMAHVINKVTTKDLETTPYGSGSNPMPVKEANTIQDPVKSSLWQAYNEFKSR